MTPAVQAAVPTAEAAWPSASALGPAPLTDAGPAVLPAQPLSRAKPRLRAALSRAVRNPRWFAMDLASRFMFVRRAVRRAVRALAPLRVPQPVLRTGPTMLATLDAAAFVRNLRVDGFSSGLLLPPDVTEQLRTFALLDVCYGHGDPSCGFLYVDRARAEAVSGRTFSLGAYLFTDDVQDVIERIAADPLLQRLVGAYLGVPPVFTGSRLWWTFAVPEPLYDRSATTSFFHYDRDDFACLRVFFYLTPVHDAHGAHVVVRGSHLRKPLSQIVSIRERNDEEIEHCYGAGSLVTIHGEAGSGFAEDPFCFHKATRPIAGDRLVLEVRFAMHDYKIFRCADRATARTFIT